MDSIVLSNKKQPIILDLDTQNDSYELGPLWLELVVFKKEN